MALAISRNLVGADANVYMFAGVDRAEAYVKAVGEHQGLAGSEVRLDGFLVELRLLGVRGQNHDRFGPSSSFFRGFYREAVVLGFAAGGAAFREANRHGDAGITKV